MHFKGCATLWGPCRTWSCASCQTLCIIFTLFLFFCLIPPYPQFLPLSVAHCNLAQYWPRLWPMPCCSDPGTWTGTETPGDMRPARETDTDTLFGWQTFNYSASSQRQDRKSWRTSVGVGWGRSLQMRGGVRWRIKAARGRRWRRQHAGVGGGRLGRNRLESRVWRREKIRFKLDQMEK